MSETVYEVKVCGSAMLGLSSHQHSLTSTVTTLMSQCLQPQDAFGKCFASVGICSVPLPGRTRKFPGLFCNPFGFWPVKLRLTSKSCVLVQSLVSVVSAVSAGRSGGLSLHSETWTGALGTSLSSETRLLRPDVCLWFLACSYLHSLYGNNHFKPYRDPMRNWV